MIRNSTNKTYVPHAQPHVAPKHIAPKAVPKMNVELARKTIALPQVWEKPTLQPRHVKKAKDALNRAGLGAIASVAAWVFSPLLPVAGALFGSGIMGFHGIKTPETRKGKILGGLTGAAIGTAAIVGAPVYTVYQLGKAAFHGIAAPLTQHYYNNKKN